MATPTRPVRVKKLAPVLIVEAIEPCLPFWERLGFVKTVEVPDSNGLGFAILAQGAVEVMYQTRRSAAADIPALAKEGEGRAALYLDVESLDAVIACVEGAPVVAGRRTTSYGAEEIFVREPGGNVVGFAMLPPG